MTDWSAPHPSAPVRGIVAVPGSKSQTNRYLVLAALAEGRSRLVNPLDARDTRLMAAALQALGAAVENDGTDLVVTPGRLRGGAIDTGLAGTVMRFVPPAAVLADGDVTFDGDPYARERPMATLLDGLRQLGAQIEDGGRGRLPFTIRGTGTVLGGPVRIDSSASSQFVSGLLLSAARYDKGVTVVHTGAGAVPSQPHLDMTLATLRAAGVEAGSPEPGVWQVAPGPIAGRDWVVEPDLSNAAPFLAAALVTGGSVTIPGWPLETTQAGDALRDLLTAMGARIELTPDGLTLTAGDAVTGLDADLHDVGELTPTIAAIATLADTPSRLHGIGHLRGHETDRVAALATEIRRLGGDVTEEPDALTIRPRPLHGGRWQAYADHRMATAGAVLGLVVPGVTVDDIACTGKTLPDFPGRWAALVGA